MVGSGAPAVSSVAPAALRFKKGTKPTAALKDLSGTATVRVTAPAEAVVAVDDVLKAQGETVKSASGSCSLRVTQATRGDDGNVRLSAELQYTGDVIPAGQAGAEGAEQVIQFQGPGQIQIQGGGRIQVQGQMQIRMARGAVAPAAPAVELPGTSFQGLELLDA